MKKVPSPYKLFSYIVGIIGPVGSYFTPYVPPLIPEIVFVVAVMSGICIYFVLAIKPKNKETDTSYWLFHGVVSLSMGIFLIVVYFLLLDLTTVVDPQSSGSRYQIGFRKADFSLTASGIKIKEQFPDEPIEEWIIKAAAFREGGPEILWKTWTIYVAGVILILCYICCFILWTSGFTFLARHHAILSTNGND